jgi:hypothetical protein
VQEGSVSNLVEVWEEADAKRVQQERQKEQQLEPDQEKEVSEQSSS